MREFSESSFHRQYRESIIINSLFTKSDWYPYSQYNSSALSRTEADENQRRHQLGRAWYILQNDLYNNT